MFITVLFKCHLHLREDLMSTTATARYFDVIHLLIAVAVGATQCHCGVPVL